MFHKHNAVRFYASGSAAELLSRAECLLLRLEDGVVLGSENNFFVRSYVFDLLAFCFVRSNCAEQ